MRQRASHRNNTWREGKLFLFGVLLSAFLVLTDSPEFQVHQVEVFSQDQTLVREISPLLPCGISLFFYPYCSKKKMILQWEPYLRDVKFRIAGLFPVTVSISPIPRIPLVLLQSKEGKFCMDRQGVIFPDKEDFTGVRTGKLEAKVPLVSGKLLPSPWRQWIVMLQAELDTVPLPPFPRFSFTQSGECLLYTKEGMCVRMGSLEGLQRRLTALPPILEMVKTRNIPVAWIDLRDGAEPYIKVLRK